MDAVPAVMPGAEALAERVGRALDLPIIHARTRITRNGDIHLQINEWMRGRETYLLCDTVTAPRQTLAELCITARCLQREAGTHITLLWPTLPLGRIAGIGTDSFCLATELLAHSGISTLYTLDAAPLPSGCMLPLHIVSPELSPFFASGCRSSQMLPC